MSATEIPEHLREVLSRVIWKYHPRLLQRLLDNGQLLVSDVEKELIREAVGSELCDHGFESDSEPNSYGLVLEELIDELAPWK